MVASVFIAKFNFLIRVAQHMLAWLVPKKKYGILPQIKAKFSDTGPYRKRGWSSQRWDNHVAQFAAQDFGDEHGFLTAKLDFISNIDKGLHAEFCWKPFEWLVPVGFPMAVLRS